MIKKLRRKLNGDIHLKDLLKGSAITFVLKMFGMFLGYIVIFIISKKNGASGVGFYNFFTQVLAVLSTFIALGMNISVLRFVGQFNNSNDQSKMHQLYRYFTRIISPFSIIIGLLIFGFAENISTFIGKQEDYVNGFKTIGCILPFFSLNLVSVEFIRGLKKLQISELIRSVLRPLLITLVLLTQWNNKIENVEIIYLFAITAIINSSFSSFVIWKELRKIPKITKNIFVKKEFIDTSFSMLLISLSAALLVALPILFLDYFTDEKTVGIFSVAFKIASLISLILTVINTMAAPKFAELFWNDKKVELQKLINQSSKIMFWISLVISITIILFSKQILQTFGDEYKNSAVILTIIVIGQFINSTSGSVGIFMNMSGNQKYSRNIMLVTLFMVTIAYFIFCPKYGILSVAIINTIGISIINISSALFVFYKLNLITFYNFGK
jgi:O-antigen/teichoic acid export membrane protein